MLIQVGDPAPNFTLYDSYKNQLTLADQRGSNTLLLFFPLAFSRICTAELCSVRDHMDRYNAVKAKVFAVSVDSLYTLAKFKIEERLNFTFLSDFNKEVSRSYGAIYENFGYGMRGVSKRAAFIIDGNGMLQYVEVLENAGEQPSFNLIIKKLEELV